MTTKTEVMKARFGAGPNGSAAAAMTTDARIFTAAIGEVVMTLNAIHRAMFVVRKAQGQRLTTAQDRFTQGQSRATAHQCKQRGRASRGRLPVRATNAVRTRVRRGGATAADPAVAGRAARSIASSTMPDSRV